LPDLFVGSIIAIASYASRIVVIRLLAQVYIGAV